MKSQNNNKAKSNNQTIEKGESNKIMDTLFYNVEWGDKSWKKIEDISLRYKDIALKNRFDFGEDTQIIIRNTKSIEKPLPNIFKLLKVPKKQVV